MKTALGLLLLLFYLCVALSYSSYRATLRRDGVAVALLTPDGVNALADSQANEIVDLLNSAPRLHAENRALRELVERIDWIATGGEERHGVPYQPTEGDWTRLWNQARAILARTPAAGGSAVCVEETWRADAAERRAAEAEATVQRIRELLEEAIDGPCLDRDLRKRIEAELSPNNVVVPAAPTAGQEEEAR